MNHDASNGEVACDCQRCASTGAQLCEVVTHSSQTQNNHPPSAGPNLPRYSATRPRSVRSASGCWGLSFLTRRTSEPGTLPQFPRSNHAVVMSRISYKLRLQTGGEACEECATQGAQIWASRIQRSAGSLGKQQAPALQPGRCCLKSAAGWLDTPGAWCTALTCQGFPALRHAHHMLYGIDHRSSGCSLEGWNQLNQCCSGEADTCWSLQHRTGSINKAARLLERGEAPEQRKNPSVLCTLHPFASSWQPIPGWTLANQAGAGASSSRVAGKPISARLEALNKL
jgi:hypothetical protein